MKSLRKTGLTYNNQNMIIVLYDLNV